MSGFSTAKPYIDYIDIVIELSQDFEKNPETSLFSEEVPHFSVAITY